MDLHECSENYVNQRGFQLGGMKQKGRMVSQKNCTVASWPSLTLYLYIHFG